MRVHSCGSTSSNSLDDDGVRNELCRAGIMNGRLLAGGLDEDAMACVPSEYYASEGMIVRAGV